MKFNKELLLDKPVAIKVISEKQFKEILDWCREEFDYHDIDYYYNHYNGETYIGIKSNAWTWGELSNKKEISFKDALLKEPEENTNKSSPEYKDITLDWSIKDIMALDLKYVEIYNSFLNIWSVTGCKLHDTVIKNISHGEKYRYRIEPLEEMTMTLEAYQKLTGIIDKYPLSVGEFGRYAGRQIRIIK